MAPPNRRHFFWLQLAGVQLRRRADRELAPLGLTTTQLGALFVVGSHDGCRLKDLARGLRVNASAVTTLALRLQKAGLVRSERSPTDRRAFELHLTQAGRDAIAQTRPRLKELNQALEEGFSEEELDTVHRFLRRCSEWSDAK